MSGACVGIDGNEEADAATRNAADSPRIDAIAIPSDDRKIAATSTIINVWQQMRNTRQSKRAAVKQSVRKWQVAGVRSPREQVCIMILRVGHTKLTPSYLLQGQERPACTYGAALTVKHVIEDCSALAELRQRTQSKR